MGDRKPETDWSPENAEAILEGVEWDITQGEGSVAIPEKSLEIVKYKSWKEWWLQRTRELKCGESGMINQ